MKSIFTYIIALFLLSNFVYGSEEDFHTSNIQVVQIYQAHSYRTPEEWKTIPRLDNPRITAAEKEIATERAIMRTYGIGSWKLTNKQISLKNDAWHSGCKTPSELCEYFYSKSELQKQSQKLMNKAQHCLESLMFRIDDNFKRQKLFIHSPGNELYFDSITKEELRDRVMLHENIYGTKRWIGCSDSEDEEYNIQKIKPTKKHRGTK